MQRFLLGLAFVVCSTGVYADEGMWTYDNFPTDKVAKKYNFQPTAEWLDKVRLGSARLAAGCSGSFVSPTGLVMTNHHCAHSCIEELSSAKSDFVAQGFSARTLADEKKCPSMEVNQLLAISDVTDRLGKVTSGKIGREFADAQRGEMARIKQECATSEDLRCDVVTLYSGGQYSLYKYKRYQDVRLVFAPEFDIAFFGGDPDNFNFPRYDLDVSFVRVYEKGQPAATQHYFPFAKEGVKAGDLTFVSGHPGRTSREATTAELAWQRDVQLPHQMLLAAELRGIITEFGRRGAEQKRVSSDLLFGIENFLKSARGRHATVGDPMFFAKKMQEEKDFRTRIAADQGLQKQYGAAWENIIAATQKLRAVSDNYELLERGRAFDSESFKFARTLVRAAAELSKPNDQRLREYVDSSLPELKQNLFTSAPVPKELEITRLTFGLIKFREILGADHPLVKTILGKKTPEVLAKEMINGSQLQKISERKRLFEGGAKALESSKDPLILLAKAVDTEARAVRHSYDDEIMSEINRNHEMIAKARFALFGKAVYPDATFTLRLSYGTVEGWKEGEKQIAPITNFGGAFERATGSYPFALPASWIKAQSKLNPSTPFNFSSNNDIVGGNSGSPVINKEAEIVGLVFDGNLPSLGGTYAFDPINNRAVSVHSEALLEALQKIYGAQRLADELKPR